MNKNIIIAVAAILMTTVANAWPYYRPVPNGTYTAYQQQRVVNTLAYTGTRPAPMQVAAAPAVAPAKTCNTPGVARVVYVRAKHKVVNGVRVYIPAHYETRVGTYR